MVEPLYDIVGEFKNSQKMWLDFLHFPMPSGEKLALLMCLYEFANNILRSCTDFVLSL
jgi:hypothetical protein